MPEATRAPSPRGALLLGPPGQPASPQGLHGAPGQAPAVPAGAPRQPRGPRERSRLVPQVPLRTPAGVAAVGPLPGGPPPGRAHPFSQAPAPPAVEPGGRVARVPQGGGGAGLSPATRVPLRYRSAPADLQASLENSSSDSHGATAGGLPAGVGAGPGRTKEYYCRPAPSWVEVGFALRGAQRLVRRRGVAACPPGQPRRQRPGARVPLVLTGSTLATRSVG